MRHAVAAGLVLVTLPTAVPACTPEPELPLLAREATASDAATRERAQAALRACGPSGLYALLARGEVASPAWRDAVDRVAGQKDAHLSRLYWYTDLEAAIAEARHTGRPILSLRLLGRLDEELSCANSRFFRVALYPDATISKMLSERFVLHWQSVRPAPKLTVDFGDGRKLERTVTGNSLHLVLAPDGTVVDVLPGLYGPRAFAEALARVEVAASLGSGPARAELVRPYHRQRLEALDHQWRRDLTLAGLPSTTPLPALPGASTAARRPDAADAAPLALSKMAVEAPLVRELVPASADPRAFPVWDSLSVAYLDLSRLDEAGRSQVAAKAAPGADVAALVASFERSMARDTAMNEHLFHRALHGWLAEAPSAPSPDALTARVYAELFLTPDGDPWLGLAPPQAFAAIQGDGRTGSGTVGR